MLFGQQHRLVVLWSRVDLVSLSGTLVYSPLALGTLRTRARSVGARLQAWVMRGKASVRDVGQR